MVAALGEEPRRDKTVAAVVARPGHDGDATAGALERQPRLGDRPAGALHQIDAGDAAGDCQPVGLRHFAVGEELDHARATITNAAFRREITAQPLWCRGTS